mgnify:CR=1 FL=1
MKNDNSFIKQIKTNSISERKSYRKHLFIAINNLETNLLDEKTIVLKKLVA